MIQGEVGANWSQTIAAIARPGKPEIGKPKTLVSQSFLSGRMSGRPRLVKEAAQS